MLNLTLASVEELSQELLSRCDDGVIVIRKKLDNGNWAYSFRDKGHFESVMFILLQTQEKLLREYNEDKRPLEPWEEF